jgi:hypothetical protein
MLTNTSNKISHTGDPKMNKRTTLARAISALPIAAVLTINHSFAVTLYTNNAQGGNGISGCVTYVANSSANCALLNSNAIDLNTNTGYRWRTNYTKSTQVRLSFKVGVNAGTRKMGVYVNNIKIAVITATAQDSPRPAGKVFTVTPVATLNAGTNTIELRDSEGTEEFDVFYAQVDDIAPFPSADIGAPTLPGNTVYSSNLDQYILNASGSDIYDANDQFRFAYSTLAGDGQITARMVQLSKTDIWAKFGVMIRKDLTGASPNIFFMLRPEDGSAIQQRDFSGGSTISSWSDVISPTMTAYPDRDVRFFKPGKWLRLVRQGSNITSYTSNDGLCWIKRRTTNMPSLVGGAFFGIAATSHNNSALTQAVFENVSVSSTIDINNSRCPRAAVDGPELNNIDYNNLPRQEVVNTNYNLISNYFYDYMRENKIPGGQLAVLKDINSFISCEDDLASNYGLSGNMVVSVGVGWADKRKLTQISSVNKFRLASVDKVVTKAIIAEIFKRNLYNLNKTNKLKVYDKNGVASLKTLDQVPFGDIPVLSYLNDYLGLNIQPYPGMSFPVNMDRVTINHLLTHNAGVAEWNVPNTPGIFSYDNEKFFMMERAAFDYKISTNDWQPVHLARWILSQPLPRAPGLVESYSSNGMFLLRFLAESVLRAKGRDFLSFVKQDMGLSNMFITNENLNNRVPNEVGYYVPDQPSDFVDNRPFLDHYFAIGSSAEQMSRFFEKYMLEYKWDGVAQKFRVDAGGAAGNSPGAFATVRHNKCHFNPSGEKFAVTVLTNKMDHYDHVADHTMRALTNYPKCSHGTAFALNPTLNQNYFIRANGNLIKYLGVQNVDINITLNAEGNNHNELKKNVSKGTVVAKYHEDSNIVSNKWALTDVDGTYFRISTSAAAGTVFLHAENKDSQGTPLIHADLYSKTNAGGTGLGGWWTAMWKKVPSGDGITYKIQNRFYTNMYLGAENENEGYEFPGSVKLYSDADGGKNIQWSFCSQ